MSSTSDNKQSDSVNSESGSNNNSKSKSFMWVLLLLLFIFIVIIIIIGCCLNRRVGWIKYDTYIDDDPKLNELRNIFNKFWKTPRKWKGDLDILNHRDLTKEVKLYKGDKSYTINKKEIFMCLTDENGKYYPTNMLIYVLAHEFAHVISVSIGHTAEFHDKFDQLLDVLIKDGVYDPSEEIILDYCQH